MDRAIAPDEAAVVRWLLDHAAVGDVSPYRIPPVEELRVLKGCECGCASLDFEENAWGGAAIIADAFAVQPYGQRAGLILWGRAGQIVLLEIYDCDPGGSHRFPEIADLRSYQEHGWG